MSAPAAARRLWPLVAVLALAVLAAPASAQTPPGQKKRGPGGAEASFERVEAVLHESPDGDQYDYYTYEPRGFTGRPAERPERLPVIVFTHGYGAWNPGAYAYWLDHLARAGNLVVYPRYQESRYAIPALYTPNAIAATTDALSWLRANSKLRPWTGRGMVLIGHSYGGAVAANIAARAKQAGLPKAAAILLIEPFVENGGFKPPDDAIDPDLSAIPRNTEAVCLVADNDFLAGRLGCDEFVERTTHLRRRDYAWLHSDDYGEPDLVADHYVPSVLKPPDAYDFRGVWKLGDALRDCSLFDTHCAYGVGGGNRQTSLGNWSDGTPVRPLDVTQVPPPCPAPGITLGC